MNQYLCNWVDGVYGSCSDAWLLLRPFTVGSAGSVLPLVPLRFFFVWASLASGAQAPDEMQQLSSLRRAAARLQRRWRSQLPR
jgi:hypothetical protein